jgi:hypothetical protein
MKLGIRRTTVVVGAVALMTLGIGTPNAVAGQSQQIRTERAGASFWDFGEDLVASDYKDDDGYSARAYLTWEDGNEWVTTDNGDDVDSSERSFDIEENTTVTLTLCYIKDGKVDRCSRPQQAIA